MKLEYLFKKSDLKEELKKYKNDKVSIIISENIGESDCWILTFDCNGENENSAKILSDVNENIIKKYDTTVLTNESSAYFNKILYPLVNNFERKLRKLLYIKVTLNAEDKRVESIENLEEMDLGSIFTIIFADKNFVTQIKNKVIKGMTWDFTKFELIKEIENIDEDVLWNHLLEETKQTDLPQKFLEIKKYRNDIMHAHNINYESFLYAKKLFNKINKQIDEAIDENKPDKDFNIVFDNALKKPFFEQSEMIALRKLQSTIESMPYLAELRNLQSTIESAPYLQELIKLQSRIDSIQCLAELGRFQSVIGKNKKEFGITNDFESIKDIEDEKIEEKIIEEYLEEETNNDQTKNANA